MGFPSRVPKAPVRTWQNAPSPHSGRGDDVDIPTASDHQNCHLCSKGVPSSCTIRAVSGGGHVRVIKPT